MKSKMQTIILCVSAGIAAYKLVELVNKLRRQGHPIHVIMTPHAVSMFGSRAFEKASGNPVKYELFPQPYRFKKILQQRKVDHIDLADRADLFVIAPATANTIGKIASGIADDFLTTTLLATTAPILICPSMNSHMWIHPAVQQNINLLKSRGYCILPPVPGPLACGYDGIGRLPEISAIYNKIIDLLKNSKRLKGKKILVTAGGTFEAIDGVRGISNRSSGKMGAAIADVCYKEGAAVLLLRARSAVHPTYPIKEQEFENASELSALIKHHIKDFDIVFHTAAVSDYAVESPLTGKLDSVKSLTLKLKPTEKIISKMKEWNPNILLIGFKAVWNLTEKEKIKEGNRKLQSSKADYVVVNDISRTDIGFQNDNNEVVLVARKGEPKNIPKMSKIDLSSKIIDAIIR